MSACAHSSPYATSSCRVFGKGETKMKKTKARSGKTPSQLIDNQIAELGDWRGKTLAQVRKLVLDADAGIVEEWKWNTAVWSRGGMVCSACAFKDHVKLNF